MVIERIIPFQSINRIRLEFKVVPVNMIYTRVTVLIESDWNLKLEYRLNIAASIAVLIESDWNLKWNIRCRRCTWFFRINRIRLEFKGKEGSHVKNQCLRVLIESDWNLKYQTTTGEPFRGNSINRIRLEFKVMQTAGPLWRFLRINRIRLEFKDVYVSAYWFNEKRINRIRLEFKDDFLIISVPFLPVLIESDWNLKTI